MILVRVVNCNKMFQEAEIIHSFVDKKKIKNLNAFLVKKDSMLKCDIILP